MIVKLETIIRKIKALLLLHIKEESLPTDERKSLAIHRKYDIIILSEDNNA